jgi:hypothetical protein
VNRMEWMAALAPLIRPRAPLAAATQLGKMLRFLSDIHDAAFTEESIGVVASRVTRSPNLAQLRAALEHYLRGKSATVVPIGGPTAETLRERQRLAERDEFLAHNWDDPDGIRARIRTCNGEMKFLRMLAALVQRHAPQHLGLLPPAAIEAMEAPDPEPATTTDRAPRPLYATPEQLRTMGVRRPDTAPPEPRRMVDAEEPGIEDPWP